MRNPRNKITTVSFDADGTLVTPSFADLIWLEVLPQIVSESWNIPLEDAKAKLFADYDAIGPNRMEWYDLTYWVKRYRLDITPKSLVIQYKAAVTPYPEVIDVLEALKDDYHLIVISNSARLFLDMTTEALRGYFRHTFSTISDFGMMKETPVYISICEKIGVKPFELAHVGDSFELDYIRARKAGLRAFFLDRYRKKRGRRFVTDLKEFKQRLSL
jgi:putative hydrolase of the HAD superfamily